MCSILQLDPQPLQMYVHNINNGAMKNVTSCYLPWETKRSRWIQTRTFLQNSLVCWKRCPKDTVGASRQPASSARLVTKKQPASSARLRLPSQEPISTEWVHLDLGPSVVPLANEDEVALIEVGQAPGHIPVRLR